MKKDPVKILVVDDEDKIVQVVSAYLEKEGYQVFKAYTGTEALKTFADHNPDFLVLDLMLPDISGEEVCRRIRCRSRVPILMLTAKVAEESLLTGFSYGADDYLTKPFSPRELIVRIEAILRRDNYHAAAKVFYIDGDRIIVDIDKGLVIKDCGELNLTTTEFRILEGFITQPGRIFSREDIIRIAFGDDFDGNDRTIDSHIKNLRGKIEDDSKSPRFIITVHGRGYRFEG